MSDSCRRNRCRRDRHALEVLRNHWRRVAETPRHREQANAQLLLMVYGTDADRAWFNPLLKQHTRSAREAHR